MLILYFVVLILRPWRHAYFSNAYVPIAQILGMRLRGNPPDFLIDAYIILKKSDVAAPIGYVEVIYINNKNRVTTPVELAELVKENLKNIED